MTKAEFIDEVARKTGQSKKDAGDAVDEAVDTNRACELLLQTDPDLDRVVNQFQAVGLRMD